MNNFSLQIPVVTLPNMHKTAVLLTNLGSPDAPTSKALKPYLTEFLMDEKVMDISYWKSLLLVKGIIVPFRAKKSAAKYRTIWTQEGSPLIACTKKQTELLGQKTNFPVYYSMRYGKPSGESVLKQIHSDHPHLEKLIVFPLYPHYAMNSYETAVEQIQSLHTK